MVDITGFADYVENVTGNVELPDISVNTSEIMSTFWDSLPPAVLQKIDFILLLSKYVLIALLVYLIIKIVYCLLKFRDSRNLALIARQTREINTKLDSIIHKKTDKE